MKEQAALDELVKFIDQHGYPPTVRELSVPLKIAHSAVAHRLDELERKGYIKRKPWVARGLKVVEVEGNDGERFSKTLYF